MEPALQSKTRIVKFGRTKSILSTRNDAHSTSLTSLGWSASSGSTYMWKMIEDDVKARYKVPDSEDDRLRSKLRIVIITDGHDTDSPGAYRGVKGMDPMMKALLSVGYNIEFNIIVIGQVQDSQRYRNLATATGGGYLSIPLGFFVDNKDKTVGRFVKNLIDGTRRDDLEQERLRQQQQSEYKLNAAKGTVERFEWLSLLPPPPPPPPLTKSDRERS